MIKRLVFGFGPPKCGQDTVGRSLQMYHNWMHVSMRRSLLETDKAFDGSFNITENLNNNVAIADDILIAALVTRLAHSARWDSGKNLFFQGLFGGTTFAKFAIEYSSHFARQVEVVEFEIEDHRVQRRIQFATKDGNCMTENIDVDILEKYQKRAADFRRAIGVAAKVARKPVLLRRIDANGTVDDNLRQIIRPKDPSFL